ncbi:cleft lip and palate transmembrane protein 1-domain-containing protein [Entophlyctis helioformis]|nr:cleft lip and palate transmembrane protein 1-domain-containing protein [Entophlyctis helioformis]
MNAPPPAPAQAVAGQPPAQQQQQQQGMFSGFFGTAMRMLFIYYLVSYISSPKQSGTPPAAPSPLDPSAAPAVGADGQVSDVQNHQNLAQDSLLLDPAGNYIDNSFKIHMARERKVAAFKAKWKLGRKMDLHVYVSDNDRPSSSDSLLWQEKLISFGDWNDVRERELDIPCTPALQNNGSLFAHIFLAPSGSTTNINSPAFNLDDTLYIRKPLTRFLPKKKVVKRKKLVSSDASKNPDHADDDDDEDDEDEVAAANAAATDNSQQLGLGSLLPLRKPRPIISYWWPNVTLNIIASDNDVPVASPAILFKHIRLSDDGLHFLPIFYANDFWMLSDQLMPINETVKSLHLSLKFAPLEFWRFQLYTQFDESLRMQQTMMGADERDTDQLKRIFLETNPILLTITVLVSVLHSAFDFLAFKNDIDFWKNRKNNEGISFRAIILNVVFQLIIFLYLMDNDTSWMILISNGIGLLIEIWKINKTVIVKRKAQFPFFEFKDRVKPTKLVTKTRKYDELAFRYLSYALFPLLSGYTVYSLVYEEHKSWYSFIVSTLVGFVYTFGFISMTPQLFINYKLKSVAHMPWKTFMYKALNTFIDDLFAFVIKMPWLHRIACLRDDIIFVIYLYQRWVYPEDKRRRNEFGQVGEATNDDNDDDDEDSDGNGSGDDGGNDADGQTKTTKVIEDKKDGVIPSVTATAAGKAKAKAAALTTTTTTTTTSTTSTTSTSAPRAKKDGSKKRE